MTFEEIIQVSNDLGIDGDSHDYRFLYDSAIATKDVDGMVCEIGIRNGLGILIMMLSGNPLKTYIGIDPYGLIDYLAKDDYVTKFDYTNEMKFRFLKNIYTLAFQYNINFQFFNMTDSQFFQRFNDGVPTYESNEFIVNTYSLVSFDGPHTTKTINSEIDFFIPRTSVGGMYVFDDVKDYYDHDSIEGKLFDNGFELTQMGYKKSYTRISA